MRITKQDILVGTPDDNVHRFFLPFVYLCDDDKKLQVYASGSFEDYACEILFSDNIFGDYFRKPAEVNLRSLAEDIDQHFFDFEGRV